VQRLVRVGVFSLAKVLGCVGLLMGLIVGIPWGLILILVGLIDVGGGNQPATGFAGAGIVGGLTVIVLLPLTYGFASFVGGLIYGLILNLVLSLAGGLELEIRSA
jgi:hypothetical protein